MRQSTLSAEELEKAPPTSSGSSSCVARGACNARPSLEYDAHLHSLVSPHARVSQPSRNTLRAPTATNRLSQDETIKDLEVERAAHDETAEKMVQLQQRLEVTLQELANLERYTKRQRVWPAHPAQPRPRSASSRRPT